MEQPFDFIIVGAGAAGCVLAARLSEDSTKRVLLLEAGPDAAPDAEHPDIRDPFPVAYSNARFCWPDLAAEAGVSSRATPYIQGYGVGGSSNVNGMAADRGQPADYEEWCRLGAAGWSWNKVLPYFIRLERDLDFSGAPHGNAGPMPVRRVPPASWAPLNRALGRALERRGYPVLHDFNADFRDGVSSVPMSCLPDQRVSASMAYLTPAVRSRANLTILPDTLVERLDTNAGRVRGVLACTSGSPRRFEARETLIACGALQSPALLMRSGIGPARQLRALKVELVRDLPGVGRNLQNHPMVMLVMHLTRSAMQASAQRAWQQNQLRYSSGLEGCPEHDMILIPFNKVSWHALGRRIGALLIHPLKAFSTGTVELTSRDARVSPCVRFNLLSDERDFERLVAGVRFGLQLLTDGAVKPLRNEVFLPSGRVVARLARRNFWSRVQAWGIARAFDIAPLRRRLLRKVALNPEALVQDEGALRQFVHDTAQAVYHVCGTCRMGRVDDQEAVVDAECRVIGVAGLRVIDASIFPSLPCANTHFPVLMAAEKMADHMTQQYATA